MRNLLLVTILVGITAMVAPAFAGPNYTTYQARIMRPDGYPLEDANVNFRFSILTPTGNCILFSETYNAVNMMSSGGYVTFSLGSGTKVFPADSTTFKDVFSNSTPTLNCAPGGLPFYIPGAGDTRKLIMQFQHGQGWQTIPAMTMNAIPYAMFADDANTLNGKTEAEFVFKAAIPTCTGDERLLFNGVSFACTIANAASGTVSVSSISSALGYTPVSPASFTTVTSSIANDITVVSNSLTTLNSEFSSVSATVISLNNSVNELFQTTLVTSGSTYTKVIVDGRGRVLSGANISSSDISTALGFSPVAPTSFTAITNSLASDIASVSASVSALNTVLNQTTSVTSGATYTKISVDGRGRVITGTDIAASDIVSALGFYPLATLNLGSASATGTLASARLPAFSGDVTSVSGSANLTLANSGVVSGSYNLVTVDSKGRVTSGANVTVVSSQWITSGTSLSYPGGNVGVGTQSPQTTLDVSGAIRVGVTVASCSSANEGAQRYNPTSKEMEFCNGTAWTAFGGSSSIPTGAIMAFDLTTCPTGWTEYTAARGRFLRGIDNGAGNDPSGTRAPGNVQADDFKSHTHTPNGYFVSGASGADGDLDGSQVVTGYDKMTMTGSLSSTGGTETRPKNVAVLYCRKN